ncbi:hypothetical protein Hanom_Chr15g01392531 [Helianthus anomalus]
MEGLLPATFFPMEGLLPTIHLSPEAPTVVAGGTKGIFLVVDCKAQGPSAHLLSHHSGYK